MDRYGSTLAVTVLATALIGCGGGGGGEVEGSIDELAVEMCDLAFRCCDRGEIDYYFGPFVGDEENCVERLHQNAEIDSNAVIGIPFAGSIFGLPNIGVVQRAVSDGRTSIDGEALDACIAYLQGLSCNEYVEVEPPTSCEPPEVLEGTPCTSSLIFIGRVGEGGECTSPGASLECETGLICRAIAPLGVTGSCVRPGVENDYCFDDSECSAGLYCSLFDGTCQVPKAVGEACLYADPDDPSPPASTLLIECEPLLGCDPVTDTCVEACDRGAACFSDLNCDEDAGLFCILGRCDSPREEGLPCGAEDDCMDGLLCAPTPGGGELTCQPPLENGEPCSTSRPQDCLSGYCNSVTLQCDVSVGAGELCPSGSHTQCDDAWCRTTFQSCTIDDQCAALSGVCNVTAGRCEYSCVAELPDGAVCIQDVECTSQSCINGFCRTLPIANGQPCESNFQCASEFCNFEATRVCEELPLPNGRVCTSATQCASGVCFEGSCQNGQTEGADCTNVLDAPCGKGLYCDRDATPDTCTVLKGTGELCDSADECWGTCAVRFGRTMCDDSPAEEAAVCDGP